MAQNDQASDDDSDQSDVDQPPALLGADAVVRVGDIGTLRYYDRGARKFIIAKCRHRHHKGGAGQKQSCQIQRTCVGKVSVNPQMQGVGRPIGPR